MIATVRRCAPVYDVRETRRVPSLQIVGGAWVTYRVTLRCSSPRCPSEHVAAVTLWGVAGEVPCVRESERAEHHPAAALDAAASALAARWAYTSRGALRCPTCRTSDDCGTVST